MNKRDYTGWKDVFTFSFIQGIKSKAYKVSLLIFAGLCLVGVPFLGFVNSKGSDKQEPTKVENLFVCDSTSFSFDYENLLKDARYSALKISEKGAEEFGGLKEELKNNPQAADVLVKVDYDPAGVFSLTFVKGNSPIFSADDYEQLTEDFRKEFEEAKITAIDVTKEQMEHVTAPVEYVVEKTSFDENHNAFIEPMKENEGISFAEYSILLGGLIFVMMIINLSGGQIANQIVTEKSTRVVEYLMINVRPLALIIGKILSSLLMVVIEFAVMIVGFIIGNRISETLFGTSGMASESSIVLFVKSLSQISPARFALCLVVVLLGVLFFSIIAGLAGASVSKMEEMAEGMKLYQLFLILGSYTGIAVCIMQMSGSVDSSVITALSIFPVSAPFILPGNLILGKISMMTGIIGAVLLAVVTSLLYMFTAGVYEAMIFYNGKVLKIKDIIGIYKKRRV